MWLKRVDTTMHEMILYPPEATAILELVCAERTVDFKEIVWYSPILKELENYIPKLYT